jgi:hypothetical protein
MAELTDYQTKIQDLLTELAAYGSSLSKLSRSIVLLDRLMQHICKLELQQIVGVAYRR